MAAPSVPGAGTPPPSGDEVLRLGLADVLGSNTSRYVALSRREAAQPLREQIEEHLSTGGVVELDFTNTETTQSFFDELIGLIVLERGPSVLPQLRFRRCSADMKAIVNFVIADRIAQHLKSPHFHAPRVSNALPTYEIPAVLRK